MSFNLCTSVAIVQKMGLDANSDAATSNALLSNFCDQAESTLCLLTRYDWVTNLSKVKTNFQPTLADVTSDLAAMKGINFDITSYPTRLQAQTMLDVLDSNSKIIIKQLGDKKNQALMLE